MLKKQIISNADLKLLNDAVEKELFASNHYKYAASCTQKQGLFGVQKFFESESSDEITHYYKVRDFANDMGAEVDMPLIDEVEFKDETLMGILSESYDLELALKEQYMNAWKKADDVSVKVFLQDMVEIQTKAVGEYGDLIAQLEQYGVALFDMNIGK